MAQIQEKGTENPIEGSLALAHEYSRGLRLERLDFKRYTGQHIGEQAKYVQIRFSEDQIRKWDSLELIHLTDVQYGHETCKDKRIDEFNDWVLSKPNRFYLWGGDMIDAAHIGSPGGPYDNKWRPSIQLKRFCALMAPVAHRVLGYVGGNHERRPNLYFGDLGLMIATLLQIPYSDGQQTVDVHWGEHKPFRNELWHGTGTARTTGAKANMIVEHMKQNPMAHMIWVGHLHEPISLGKWVKIPDPANMKVKLRKQWGAMSSSFLDFWGTYGEVKGLAATDVEMARVVLEGDGHWMVTHR